MRNSSATTSWGPKSLLVCLLSLLACHQEATAALCAVAYDRILSREVPAVQLQSPTPRLPFSLTKSGPWVLPSCTSVSYSDFKYNSLGQLIGYKFACTGANGTQTACAFSGIAYDTYGRATGYAGQCTVGGGLVNTLISDGVYNGLGQLRSFTEERTFPGSCASSIKVSDTTYNTSGTVNDFLVSVNVPLITNFGVAASYDPWAVWVLGNSFTANSRVTLFDGNNGPQWGNPIPVSLGGDSSVSFQLPGNMPPSRCNDGVSCIIAMKISNEYGTSSAANLKLPAIITGGRSTITQFGLAYAWEPWVVWMQGTNFTPKSRVFLIDTDGKQWGEPIQGGFANESAINISLPADIPPSGCNRGRSCTIPIQMYIETEFGTSDIVSLKLPAIYTDPKTPVPSIRQSGVVKAYQPWAVWVQGMYFTPTFTVTLFDSTGKQWGSSISRAFGDESGVSFQLPSNLEPYACNWGRTCIIQMQITSDFGTSVPANLELPAFAF